MKKIVFVLIVMLFVLSSCENNYWKSYDSFVSNKGSVSVDSEGSKTVITVVFDEHKYMEVAHDDTLEKIYDSGIYDTLIDVFRDNNLKQDRKYCCTVDNASSVAFIEKKGASFVLYSSSQGTYETITGKERFTRIDMDCTLKITYGGETVVNYTDIPISPDGLPSGSIWNDNGTIRIV